jgi:hypothetical protein
MRSRTPSISTPRLTHGWLGFSGNILDHHVDGYSAAAAARHLVGGCSTEDCLADTLPQHMTAVLARRRLGLVAALQRHRSSAALGTPGYRGSSALGTLPPEVATHEEAAAVCRTRRAHRTELHRCRVASASVAAARRHRAVAAAAAHAASVAGVHLLRGECRCYLQRIQPARTAAGTAVVAAGMWTAEGSMAVAAASARYQRGVGVRRATKDLFDDQHLCSQRSERLPPSLASALHAAAPEVVLL